MRMRRAARSTTAGPRGRSTAAFRALATALAGVCCAVIVSCGSSGQGLIPASAAGPLKSDLEAIQQTAESANGDCTATEAAVLKTEEDFQALPTSVNAGLRNNLRQGIENLKKRAHEMCVQPSAKTTTSPPKTTTTTPTTTTTTTTAQPTTTPSTTTATTPTTSSPGGGTEAPGEEEAGEAAKGGAGEQEGGAGGVGAGEPPSGK
jgi:hypothetical protein